MWNERFESEGVRTLFFRWHETKAGLKGKFWCLIVDFLPKYLAQNFLKLEINILKIEIIEKISILEASSFLEIWKKQRLTNLQILYKSTRNYPQRQEGLKTSTQVGN